MEHTTQLRIYQVFLLVIKLEWILTPNTWYNYNLKIKPECSIYILTIPVLQSTRLTCFNMRDRLERFVLLPFTAGCISESSIPVVIQNTKRSKLDRNSTCTRKHEEEYLDDESVSSENLKTALLRFQKLFKNFKNFSQLFVYKDELEPEMGMEIGLPTDVKHVNHIGLDGSASSFFSKGWKDISEPEFIDLHSFPLTQLELAITAQDETPNMRSLLETKCNFHGNEMTQGKVVKS